MANRTVKDATSIHGTNPQYLVEKIIRTRIYDSKYWKEECFALTAELLVDKAMELRAVGGVFGGNIKPTPFICLILKMLQIQPEKDIIIEFIKQDEFKYVRALGAFYLRLVYSSLDCYKYLEPLLNDYRKLRSLDRGGQYSLTSMDEFIDDLLREERYCDVILPRIQKRWVHEECNELEGRVSLLDDDLEDLESESEDEEIPPPPPKPEPVRPAPREEKHSRGAHSPSRRSPGREIMRTERDREREREKRHRSRSRSRERERTKRHRSRSRERRHRSPVAIKKIEMHGSFPRGHAYNHHHRESEREREPMRNPLYRRDHREERPQRDSHRNRGEIERGRVRERERLERPERMERLERLERPERAMRERDHYGRERGREREREREGNREHRERKSEKESRKEKHRSEKKDRREANGMSKEDMEIAEANSLRAQLGLPPLKP